jgi:preprotein translocase subunit YajC
MLISSAYAQAAGAAPGGLDSQIMSFAPLVLIFVVFYFLLIRPQQKRMKQHKEMLGSIRRGDRVVTNGGIIGTVNKVVNNDELILEIADGVRVRAMRSMVASVVAKTEPAGTDEDEAAASKS